MDEGFQRHIQRAAASFKEAIRHSVSEYLVSKYTGVRRQLSHLDNRDMEQARAIARRQILRSNQRMTTERVDQLLTVVQQDVAQGSTWELATGRRYARHPLSREGSRSIPAIDSRACPRSTRTRCRR